MSLRTADYDYQLPDDLIAHYPAERRDESRMMLVERDSRPDHPSSFRDFAELIRPEELVVLNNTKVVPARIRFPDRNAEMLLLEQIDPLTWRCLVRPGKSFPLGRTFSIHGHVGRVVQIGDEGDRLIRFDRSVDLDEIGEIPLPPYITRCRRPSIANDIKPSLPLKRGRLLRRPPGCILLRVLWTGSGTSFLLCTWESEHSNR